MIVLDTHALIWWVGNSEKLPDRAKRLIDKEQKDGEILISSISVWEMAILVRKGRIKLSMDLDKWVAEVENVPSVRFVPVDNRIAMTAVYLSEPLHQDPADRIIVATAIDMGAFLVSGDRKIKQYKEVKTVW